MNKGNYFIPKKTWEVIPVGKVKSLKAHKVFPGFMWL